MIKVLNILSDTNIGGAGHAVLNYLKNMDRTEFSAAVVLPRGSEMCGPVRALGVPLYEVDAMADKSFDPPAVKMLIPVIRDFDPDVVHTHGSLSGRIAARRCRKAVVCTRHSAFPFPDAVLHTPLRWVYRYLYTHYADRIIAISPAGAAIMTDCGVPKGRLDVMMNGVEPLPSAGPEERAARRKELGLADGDFALGYIARIEEYKGHLDVLEAVKLLRDDGRPVKLVIAGTGDFEPQVRSRAQELGIADAVIFTGFVKDVARVFSALDVQVNASYISEACSLSLQEGMSVGIPTVASDCCGNPWIVDDNETGFLFTPRDPRSLAGRVARLMDDPELLEKFRRRSEEEYREKFTGKIYARNVENVYRKALAARRKG